MFFQFKDEELVGTNSTVYGIQQGNKSKDSKVLVHCLSIDCMLAESLVWRKTVYRFNESTLLFY